MSREFVETLLVMIGIAVGLGLVVAGLVYAGGPRRAKRYRPGRPFAFTPVWFLASPRRAAPGAAGRELPEKPATARARHGETGGASDRW